MNNKEFASKAVNIAENYNTAYVWGAFGLVANAANMQRMINQYSKNNKYLARARQIYGNGYFFDCVGLIKGILWGWCGNSGKTYGGATYASNGVPDASADQMITYCSGVSTNFSNIEVGEAVWLKGHIGIYVGNGIVVEATPSWNGGVQKSALANIGSVPGLNSRKWTKHGKLPYVTYLGNADVVQTVDVTVTDVNMSGTVKTGGSTLNLRSTYSTAGEILARIPNGANVNVLAKVSNGWYKVSYNGIIGYVCGDYLIVTKSDFSDTNGHYAANHIKKLYDYGVVSGYGDTTYRPDNNVTRGEFAVIITNALEKACGYNLGSSAAFSDISGHFSETHICKLVACGIVNGFEDGTFRPDEHITRGQAAIMAWNMLQYCGVATRNGESYPDTVGHYAENHIKSLNAYGVVNGYTDGTFKPDENITRGQAAMYVANCLTVVGK